jgi:hypothetical protein
MWTFLTLVAQSVIVGVLIGTSIIGAAMLWVMLMMWMERRNDNEKN